MSGPGTILEGSCHCGKVSFKVNSYTPYPFMVCHCHADTKTTGIYNCNVMAQADSLKVEGMEHVKIYQIERESNDGEKVLSEHRRNFCQHCASYLWAAHSSYPQWIYPFVSAIDTPLPIVAPKDQVHIMTEFKLPHVIIPDGVPEANRFKAYPIMSIEEWHKKHDLYGKDINKE